MLCHGGIVSLMWILKHRKKEKRRRKNHSNTLPVSLLSTLHGSHIHEESLWHLPQPFMSYRGLSMSSCCHSVLHCWPGQRQIQFDTKKNIKVDEIMYTWDLLIIQLCINSWYQPSERCYSLTVVARGLTGLSIVYFYW